MLDRHQQQKDEIEALKFAQLEGTVEMIEANMDSSHQIPKNEAHLYHVKVIKRMLQRDVKEFKDFTRVIKLSKADFTLMGTHSGQGWTEFDEHHVLHNPDKIEAKKPAAKKPAAKKTTKKEEETPAE